MTRGDLHIARAHFEKVLRVLRALPGEGELLPVFASRIAGDPHGLDGSGKLARDTLAAVAAWRGVPPPAGAEEARRLWGQVGVGCDRLSVTVLVAGMPVRGNDRMAWKLRAAARAADAEQLTLGQLQEAPLQGIAGLPQVVWAVENPAVVAAALGRFGMNCPPLVCTSGWPNTAAITACRQLVHGGVELRYHGDFDPEGVRIAGHLQARVGAVPTLMCAVDYETAVQDRVGVLRFDSADVPGTPWDPSLAVAMAYHQIPVHEKGVLGTLLDALSF